MPYIDPATGRDRETGQLVADPQETPAEAPAEEETPDETTDDEVVDPTPTA